MAEAVVSFFLEKLSQLLVQEVELLSGVHDDLVWMKDELHSMRKFLKDADRRREREETVQAWVARVRRLASDAEDTVDEFMMRMEMHRRLRDGPMGSLVFHACFIKRLMIQRRFAAGIQKIRREADEIDKSRKRYEFRTTIQESMDGGHHGPGASAPWVEEGDIVGQKEDVMLLEKWMLTEGETSQQRIVISIVGMGGSGKTTLAKQVYRDTQNHFDCYAWAFVSQTFQTEDILKQMLRGFCSSRKDTPPSNMEMMDESRLQETIHRYLQGKRYALVLDDIWDAGVWEDVKYALPREGGGRIIFTTRIANVASPMSENCCMHQLKPLAEDLAWELFCKKAFRSGMNRRETCPEHLLGVAQAIVKRCEGLPLAIVVVGGLLHKKEQSSFEWNEVLENLDWELSHNQELSRLSRVLAASYNFLPSHLKCCFLYCCLFPEDHRIRKAKVIRMWVAEGFIEEHPRKSLEAVANDCFLQLIDRNLLQPVLEPYTSKLIACQVHDLMRDIGIHMFEKEEFAIILTSQNPDSKERRRRLVLQNVSTNIGGSKFVCKPRSLLVISEDEFPLPLLRNVLVNFKFLRVLSLEGSPIEGLPDEVGTLIHLRYLSLRGTRIKTLPASYRRLRSLQTLDVRDSGLKSLPGGIEKLSRLRHLLLSEFKTGAKDLEMSGEISGLCCLQTLVGVSLDDRLSKGLGHLTQLERLAVGEVKQQHCRQLCESISQLRHLRSLKISATDTTEQLQLEALSQPPQHLEKLYLFGLMITLPQWVGSLNCLCDLQIHYSELKEDLLPALGQLPNLSYLALRSAYAGKQIRCTHGGFPKLRALFMGGMKEVEEWIVEDVTEGGFGMPLQSLETLLLENLPKLKMLPDGFQHLVALRELGLLNMPEEFCTKVKEGGSDHHKVKHIPMVAIKTTGLE